MSNLQFPIPMAEVVQNEVDWVPPVYLIRKGGSLKSWNINYPNSFSNSSITTKLEVSNSDMVIERNIILQVPITVTLTGTNITPGDVPVNNRLLQDGAFSLRSNALAKAIQVMNVQYGNVSYAFNSSDVISAMERYNSYDKDKYNTNIDFSYLDQSTSYDDFIGSNRNPMNLYQAGIGSQVHRGAMPIYNVTNTTTTATFSCVLTQMIVSSPLLDQIIRNGGGEGLSHLNEININITFLGNLFQRMFSFAQNVNGSVLNLTSASVNLLNKPVFRFVQITDQFSKIPPVLSYSLNTVERYNTDFSFQAPYQQISSPVVQISRVPQSMLIFCRPQNNILYNGSDLIANLNGAMIPDFFSTFVNANVLWNGQTLTSNMDISAAYKVCSENGLVDDYVQFSGMPVLKSIGQSTNGVYIYPSGSVVKLVFNKDICLANGHEVAPGTNFRTNLQVNATFLNQTYGLGNNITNAYSFYMVLIYDDILQLYGDNLGVINNAPINMADVANAQKKNPSVHYDVLRNHNISGAGMLDGTSNLMRNGKKVLGLLKHGLDFYCKTKGGVGNSGGRPAPKHAMRHNLLM